MGFVHACVPLSGLVMDGGGVCGLRIMNKMNVLIYKYKAKKQLASW
jgi:hypothetical protein